MSLIDNSINTAIDSSLDSVGNVIRLTLRPGCSLDSVIEAVINARALAADPGQPPRQYFECVELDTPTLVVLLRSIEADLARWLDALGPPVQTAVVFASESQRSLVEAVRGSLGQRQLWRVFSSPAKADAWFFGQD